MNSPHLLASTDYKKDLVHHRTNNIITIIMTTITSNICVQHNFIIISVILFLFFLKFLASALNESKKHFVFWQGDYFNSPNLNFLYSILAQIKPRGLNSFHHSSLLFIFFFLFLIAYYILLLLELDSILPSFTSKVVWTWITSVEENES